MMKSKLYITFFVVLFSWGCKKTDEFLTKLPLDQLTDQTYWTSENNVRTFAWGFYPHFFPGYASGFDLSFGGYFSGQSLNDDFAPTTPTPFTRNVPASGGTWSFDYIRKANLFANRIKTVPMDEEAINNWVGIARFFRGLEYANLVERFGDVPWYGTVLNENDTAVLYKPRDPRTLVMDSVLADFQYAAQNIRAADPQTGSVGLIVNKYVVLAFMSRVFLFEGTWQKYHSGDQSKAKQYLEAAKDAADQIIQSGAYSVAPNYREIFNSLDLSGNPGIIMYREYDEGVLTHALNSYVNKEPQTGASKNAIESYLCKDGLPISISPLYKGDKTMTDVMTDRDPRMSATFVDSFRLDGVVANYSTSGYAVLKFFNEAIKDQTIGNSDLNPTDAPVIRYGEVLINYAEAAAELGTITQDDLDKSVNKLRDRNGINMPHLQIIGGKPAVNNTVYDDPKRDPDVPSMIWEIRRERRIELMMEGFRLDDLRRWAKLKYTDTKANSDINRGAWIKRADYPATLTVKIENDASEGYIIPASAAETQRIFSDPKVYLNPLPLDQIKLYKDHGVDLTQNPGW